MEQEWGEIWELKPGMTVDRYVVEEPLGEGGVATVFRVRHATLNSHHALKVLQVHHPEVARRLLVEGQSQAALKHPNILAVTDAVVHQGMPCLVMEFVAGPSLWALLEDYQPDLNEALELFRGILQGVDAAHRHGLIHRDLKPDNVLLELTPAGVVPKVADFGLVKVTRGQQGPTTNEAAFMGTPEYMAPEQIQDAGAVDHRADLFSLGCMLYELVCGVLPFEGESAYETLELITHLRFEPPEQRKPDLPRRVVRAIHGMLAPVEQRTPSCQEVLALLYPDSMVPPEAPDDLSSLNPVSHLGAEASTWIAKHSTRPVIPRRHAPGDAPRPAAMPPERDPDQLSPGQERVLMGLVAFMGGLLGVVVGGLLLRAFGLL